MSNEWKHRLLLLSVWLSIPVAIWYCIKVDDWTLFVVSYIIAQFNKLIGHNIACHRYFSHRSFKTTKFKHVLLSVWPILLASKSPITYAMNHRHHHLYADTSKDTHSPVTDFWNTITGAWEFRGYQWFEERDVAFGVKDLIRDPTLKFIERNYFKIWSFIAITTLLIDWRLFLFGVLLPAGHFHLMANTVVNTMAHLKVPGSYRTYNTPDNSQNNQVIAWLSLGEGFHNNHHADPSKYDQGYGKNEFDICAWVIDKFFIINNEQDNRRYLF